MQRVFINNEKLYTEYLDYLSENPIIVEKNEKTGYLKTDEYEFFVSYKPEIINPLSFRFAPIPRMKNVKKDYLIIQNSQDLKRLKDHIKESPFLAFDTETTGLHHKIHKIIGASFSGKVGTGLYIPTKEWKNGELIETGFHDDLGEILESIKDKELITWNGSFDVRMVKSNYGIDLSHSLIADAQLMQHTVNEEGNFALKKCAIDNQTEIGLDVEKEANEEQILLKANVKKNGGETKKTNFEMYKADLDVLGKYACADADLTLRLAFALRKQLDREELQKFYYDDEVMPLYSYVTIPMEDNGVKLDLPLMNETRSQISTDMDLLEFDIIQDLEKRTEFQSWFKSKVDKEYKTSKGSKFGQEFCKHFNIDLPVSEKTGKFSMGKKNLEKLPDSDQKDWLLFPEEFPLDEDLIFEIKSKMWRKDNGGTINIQSKTHLKELSFDYFKFKPLGYTKTGPQFDDNTIQHLADKNVSWASKLSNYNKLVKIRSTYIDRFLDNHVDGYYYFGYKQWGTISGRYSSDAQQIPRPKEEGELPPEILKYNNMLRKFFISDTGRKFIDADYESLEPHVFAHVSTDEGLRNIFRKGHDFYSTIAIKTEKLDGVSADKKAPNYLGIMNKPLRQSAKAYSLGIPYGMGDFALGKTLDISTEEAGEKIEGYLGGFPDLSKWMRDSDNFVQKNGFIKIESGRIRHLPKAKEIYKVHKDKLMDFKYRARCNKILGKEETTKLYRDYKNEINNGKNVQIQGLGASIVNRAAIECAKSFLNHGIRAYVCAQVHDQLIFHVDEQDLDEAVKIIKDRMENTTKLSIDLKAPPEIADNWCDSH